MKNIKSKLLTLGLLAAMAVFTVSGIIINRAFASLGASITPATGGTNISVDTAATASNPSWTTITGLKITETSVGDIETGIHTLTLPTGWEFNTSQTVTISLNGTELTLGSSNLTPDATQLSFNVTASSTAHTATLTFSGIQVQPSDGVVRSSAPILHSGASINGVDDETKSFGDLSTVAGTVTKLAFTISPGTPTIYGSAFDPQPIVKTQDQFGNDSTSGLNSSETVALTLTTGTGVLQGGATSTNIGTSGTETFAGLTVGSTGAVGSGKQLTATASGPTSLTAALSDVFEITAKPITVTPDSG